MINRIVIVGGGTAGWMTAAAMARILGPDYATITLVESDAIGTVGVGEATIPSIRQTLAACGIEEHIFLKTCGATFKHGIEFINWRDDPQLCGTNSYFHPFGDQIMVAGKDAPLASALESALAALSKNGRLEEIYLRYFPAGLY
mgnify:CR=1 FL=1